MLALIIQQPYASAIIGGLPCQIAIDIPDDIRDPGGGDRFLVHASGRRGGEHDIPDGWSATIAHHAGIESIHCSYQLPRGRAIGSIKLRGRADRASTLPLITTAPGGITTLHPAPGEGLVTGFLPDDPQPIPGGIPYSPPQIQQPEGERRPCPVIIPFPDHLLNISPADLRQGYGLRTAELGTRITHRDGSRAYIKRRDHRGYQAPEITDMPSGKEGFGPTILIPYDQFHQWRTNQ